MLAHGYHVQAQQWRDVVWGDPHDNHLGRVPRAVLTALEQPNPLLLFGTGAPAGDGVLESELTLHFARDHRSDLYDLASEFLAISRERSRLLVDDLLDQRSLCERTSTTTRTEVAAALQTSLQHRAHRLTLVSSPTHIARCLQSALTLLADTPGYRRLAGRVSAVASDTTVTGRGPGDVVILEPQTRPQSGAVDFADVARAVLPLLGRPSAVGYVDEWSQLTQTWLARTRA
ncbi:hypothetical protein ACFEMC_10560 [Kineococcus sp. DHX-1]|uniref:hypothetical protein n=1 Tax=Kineococcus sp. DHX-1 TaxID=3349638 RepID=UPI0036D3DC4A